MNPTKQNPLIHALKAAFLIVYLFIGLRGATLAAEPLISGAEDRTNFVGDAACAPCHQDKFSTYRTTAHHRTSLLADANSIAGSFAKGEDVMKTFNPELTFLMEARNGGFYETAVRRRNGRATKHSERIDLVIGSATKGQTYLYWRQNGLFELPVSYWVQLKRWVNSPGYVDGSADFDRPVDARCLECHATYFQPVSSSPAENRYQRANFVLGISCERCHGPGNEHVAFHSKTPAGSSQSKMPPLALSRDRQIEVCAQCHGGAGEPVAPAFSFTPGERLSDYVKLQQPFATDRIDVHGNQVILLERSRCFQASPQMSCSTCHDVHQPERPAADYSSRCLTCHQAARCGMFPKLGNKITTNCIDCHLPVQRSNTLVLDTDDQRLQANVRTHWIRVYVSTKN